LEGPSFNAAAARRFNPIAKPDRRKI